MCAEYIVASPVESWEDAFSVELAGFETGGASKVPPSLEAPL
jgi:hypothetical protein